MAYFSLHAYDADVWIREFRGLNQGDIGLNPNPNYASEAWNVETPYGVLQPEALSTYVVGGLTDRIDTAANFYRRWYKGSGSKEWFVASSGGKIWYRQADSDDYWTDMDLPSGIVSFQNNVWSCATYEITENGKTIDVLLMSNADDGMIMVVPPDRPANWTDKKEHDWDWVKGYTWARTKSARWAIRTVDTLGKKFGVIARHAERIWGGNIANEPDMLMYSKPYDPTDWNADTDHPEDGGGDILQPTWDGTSFTALIPFGDQLLAFKQNRVWRIVGTDPGVFEFREQYGEGSAYGNTIVTDGEKVYMVDTHGMSIYDGMTVSPYNRDAVKDLWKNINRDAMYQMAAAVFDEKYYLAFPEGTSTVNNALLIYNFRDGTVLYSKTRYIESFLKTNEKLFAASSRTPGRLFEVNYDSWTVGASRDIATKWVSPWMDFGYKRIQKGGFDLYFIPEVQNEAVTLKFSIQTEKKLKTKTYTVQPLTEEQRARPREHRGKRLHFGGMGRKFRVIIETSAGSTAPWRLIGGLQLVVETDPD